MIFEKKEKKHINSRNSLSAVDLRHMIKSADDKEPFK